LNKCGFPGCEDDAGASSSVAQMMKALAKKVIATQKGVDGLTDAKVRGEGQGFNSGGDERVRVGVRA
jgi:hypothetical protein